MKIQVLVATVEANVIMLAEHMNLSTEAVICNQCHEYGCQEFEHRGKKITAFALNERGVGLNRNNALMRADCDVCVFADEDIVYDDDYAEKVAQEFERDPKADILMFNVEATAGRRTYENARHRRVRWYNYGRYPTYSMCARTESLRKANVWFSMLFGGGAKYSSGEDTLFLHDCLQKGLVIKAVPVSIGHEKSREGEESTWFKGYNEKYFYDRGVLYRYLYGIWARPLALRFLLAHRKLMCRELTLWKCYALMKKGIREA
ncbi:MAG: glycosyltransferase family 2 protein [Lachnospiraceae bacterium]|jgi:glycosyltransferase involved in cell wall biosynthesis|nr:glycosyltransferase family 2 protein [Lachnospiraceae bacterium]